MGDTENNDGAVSGDEISDTELDKRFGDSLMMDGDLIDEEVVEGLNVNLAEDYGFFHPSDSPLVLPEFPNLDQETQDRLQVLLHAAGITKPAEGKNLFADPEIFRRLTSSVSCALDEAADALTRMKSSSTSSNSPLDNPSNNNNNNNTQGQAAQGPAALDPSQQGFARVAVEDPAAKGIIHILRGNF